MRILIVGNTGSGKSTMAKQLIADHGLVHLDLDTVFFEPGSPEPAHTLGQLAAWRRVG